VAERSRGVGLGPLVVVVLLAAAVIWWVSASRADRQRYEQRLNDVPLLGYIVPNPGPAIEPLAPRKGDDDSGIRYPLK
jgi:hypothetical protein